MSALNPWQELRFYLDRVESIITLENDLNSDRLEREIVRLRQALARIKNASNPNDEPVSRAIATAALEGKE